MEKTNWSLSQQILLESIVGAEYLFDSVGLTDERFPASDWSDMCAVVYEIVAVYWFLSDYRLFDLYGPEVRSNIIDRVAFDFSMGFFTGTVLNQLCGKGWSIRLTDRLVKLGIRQEMLVNRKALARLRLTRREYLYAGLTPVGTGLDLIMNRISDYGTLAGMGGITPTASCPFVRAFADCVSHCIKRRRIARVTTSELCLKIYARAIASASSGELKRVIDELQ